jgi:hypothetical protein
MTAPVKPVHLRPTSTYIHISSASDAKTIEDQAAAQNIHIEGRASIPRGSLESRDVVESATSKLKAAEGVKDAKVMETKQRAKR